MRSLKALALLGALPLTACLSIYDVRQGKDKVAGVPFYVRSAECRHKTVWLEPVYTVSLQVQRVPATPGQPLPPLQEIASVNLGLKAYSAANELPDKTRPLPDLMRDLATEQITDPAVAHQRLNALIAKLPIPLRGNADDFIRAGNTNAAESAVDYSKAYTYNVRRPWAGTASSTLKLNSDGTLGEATAEVEDKTFETIASLIPLNEFLTAEFVDAPAAAEASEMTEGSPSARAGDPFRIVLTVRTTVFRHTFSKPGGAVTGTSCAPPTTDLGPQQVSGVEYLLEELKDTATPKAADKGKTIQLSGQIVLPEDKKPSP